MRYIQVTYCDDIRHELGNKRSLMGVYATELLVTTIPATLPKLGIAVSIITPFAEPFKKLVVRIQSNKKQLVVSEDLAAGFSDSGNFIDDNFDPATEEKDYPKLAICELEFLIESFYIDRDQNIRVLAETESGEIASRALRVRRA